MDEVKLHENWLSLSACRVIWALSLKDIPYQYVEEEGITNKTPFLPYSNSLHHKVSLIVHGKSISDSSVILEYIDETWPQNPLLPPDLLDKATARFWIRFIDDKVNIASFTQNLPSNFSKISYSFYIYDDRRIGFRGRLYRECSTRAGRNKGRRRKA